MQLNPLDEQLRAGKKSLRTLPGALLLGPTGARLWADYVDPLPGFSGRFDFIHKVNVPLLFTVTNSAVTSFEPFQSDWYPSHLAFDFANQRLSFSEKKFITWDDVAVSCQTWTNRSQSAISLQLQTYTETANERVGHAVRVTYPIEHYSYDIQAVTVSSDDALLDGVTLQPGETKQFIIASAAGIPGTDSPETLQQRAEAYAKSNKTTEQVLSEHSAHYHAWFEKTPTFDSSDPVLNQTWLYRWFLLRHNLADPKFGNLQHPVFYEGRSHKKSKSPFSKGGWEFSKLINLSVPLHIMDARWYHDPSYSEGPLLNMKENPDESGMFCCLMVDTVMHSFANFSCWAAYQLYLVHRNSDRMAELLPAMKNNIIAWKKLHGNEQDQLMIEHKHTRTGKEYQPSYWYFHDYPKNPKDKATYTHLKRVDRATYHYLNTLGVAKLCEELGDEEAQSYYEQAEAIKRDIIDLMWDAETQYFYDLHYQTNEKAFVKNIVGIYPGWAEIIDDKFNGMIEHLLNKDEFNTGAPFPSVSIDCPAYSKDGGWMGHFVKGRNGCVWDGPTWPYTNSVALDSLARESKRRGHAFDKEFAHFLREYSFLHFSYRDLSKPYLVEHYNSSTGEPLSDEPEYNHSYYIDLIVSHVAGLSIEKDQLVLDPLDTGLEYFTLDRIKAAGLELKITYRSAEAVLDSTELEAGYTVYVNGKKAYQSDKLGRAVLSLKELRA